MDSGPTRLYRPTGLDRVAVVSTAPVPGGGAGRIVRVERSPGKGRPSSADDLGPFPGAEVPGRFAAAVAGLRAEGFVTTGLPALLDALNGPDRARRARAALRLGWRREPAAVPPILALLPGAVDEVCALLDALGAIGDPRGIPALREYSGRKLLSRRRSAVEALRVIGDDDGIAAATSRALEQLPAAVREAVDSGAGPEGVTQAVLALDPRQQGLALDTLYEANPPGAAAAVSAALDAVPIEHPYLWRYVKSLYKRSMLRHDPETFGRVARRVEARGLATKGTEASLKSGYDGVERLTPVFRPKTRDYLRRLGWRYLSNLAKHRPDLYATAAAESIAAYGDDAPEEPIGFRGAFGQCYLWHRVLLGNSARFRYDDRRLTFFFRDAQATTPPAGAREEARPELWDANPSAYLRVLRSARLPEAHAFALRGLKARHPRLIESVDLDEIVPLLDAPYPETVEFASGELARRFDPARPDLPLVDRLLAGQGPSARTLGRQLLRLSAPRWSADQEWVLVFLAYPDAETAALAGELAADSLRSNPALRRALAPRLLAGLRAPEPSPGVHDVYAALAGDALVAEMSALLSVADLLTFCTSGSAPLQALAGRLMAVRPEAAAHLGTAGLVTLAGHEVAAVRAAAHALILANIEAYRADPSPLFALAESDWPDTRTVAFGAVRDGVGFEALGFDGLLGLLDSNREDVRAFGRELARRHADRLDLRTLALRLTEHPSPQTRRFTLDLVVGNLPDGGEVLAGVSWFLRAALLDLRPDRLLKRRVIDFLLARGLRDAYQAEVAARLLADAARLSVRSDAEQALEAVARLSLAWPGLKLPEGVTTAGAGGAA